MFQQIAAEEIEAKQIASNKGKAANGVSRHDMNVLNAAKTMVVTASGTGSSSSTAAASGNSEQKDVDPGDRNNLPNIEDASEDLADFNKFEA